MQGFKLKGSVRIILDEGADAYIIQFFKKGQNEPYKTVEGVYFRDMVDIIDREVETDNDKSPEYAKKVNKATYKIWDWLINNKQGDFSKSPLFYLEVSQQRANFTVQN